MIQIKVKKLHPEAQLPTRGSEDSACWDVYCLEDTLINTRSVTLVRTGLAFEIPKDFFIDVRPRSGLSKTGVVIKNSPGTIDSDYRGELLVLLQMTLSTWNGNHRISKGDRIAQIRLEKVLDIEFIEVEELSDTKRGTGGFGSTGD